MSAAKHQETFVCSFWRPCCCSLEVDGHCWGCGCDKDAHADGEHKKPSEPESHPAARR